MPWESDCRVMRDALVEYLALGVIPYMTWHNDVYPADSLLGIVGQDCEIGTSVTDIRVESSNRKIRRVGTIDIGVYLLVR